jgi:UDP-glucose 4-epimerase
MRVLVIGGCGFIGSHVVDALTARRLRVRVLDRRPEAFRPPVAGVEYVTGDLSDIAMLSEALTGTDAVIHLASSTVPATSNLDPVADITGNLIGTVRLIEVMRSMGIRNIVYLSSGGTVYGIPQSDPVGEDHPLRPVSSYGVVKTAIENYLHMEHHLHGLRHCVLRASNPYGPRQGHTGLQGVIGTYLWKIVRGEPIEVWGDGSVVRDFIHVRDLAELCCEAVLSDRSGIYNAGSGEGRSINDIVAAVGAAAGRPITPVYKPGRSFDVPRVVLDIARARAGFGWSPRIALDAGIAETWDWVKARASQAG